MKWTVTVLLSVGIGVIILGRVLNQSYIPPLSYEGDPLKLIGKSWNSREIQEIYEQYFGHCDKDKKEDCKKKEKCCETVCPFCNMPLDLCECLEDD